LATTEQQKIPATILSRCQKFEFRRISSDVIANRLLYISEKEGIVTEPEAAKVIAKMAQGGMRDAISLLELCAGDGKEVTLKTVRAVTGAMGREQAAETADAVSRKDTDALFEIVEKVVSSSKEMTVFWQELTDFYRDLLVFKTAKDPARFIDLTSDEEEMLRDISGRFSPATLLRHCSLLEETYTNMLRPGASKRLCAELAFLRMCDEKLDTVPEGLTARVSALEEKIALLQSGAVQIPQSAPAVKPASAPSTAGETVMYKKSVEAPKTEAVKEPLKSGQKNVREGLKPVSWWVEAAKKIGEKDQSIAPFMKLAKGYENGNKVLIRAEGSMAVFMLDTPEMRSTLASLATTISGKPHTPDCFEFVEVTFKAEDHPINELV
jgi:DNA polymerase-3 subunit gamma/tau